MAIVNACTNLGWFDYFIDLMYKFEENFVKLDLRYPIIEVIRSQWESQDLPTLGNLYHVTDDTASQERGYNTCALNKG